MMKPERWYDVPDYEGRYQISTRGRVRSVARVDDGGVPRRTRILSPVISSSGRRYYQLSKSGAARTYCASVVMASVYGIPNPSGCRYVVHRNGDNSDFRRGNLAWTTLANMRIHDGHKVSSRYLGVARTHKGKRGQGVLNWTATLNLHRQRYRLGYFSTEEEAAYAYDCEVRRRRLDRPVNDVPKPTLQKPKIASSPGEIWRPFPGAETTHRISNRGRVKTVAYVTSNGQRVLPKLRRISVHTSGRRTVLIRDVRYTIVQVLADVFPSSARGAASSGPLPMPAPGPS